MILTEENAYSLDYALFLYNEACNQFDFTMSLLEEENAASGNENTKSEQDPEKKADLFEKFINKLIDALGKVVAKFFKNVTDFTGKNKKYLETYKDIILEKPPIKAKITDFNDYNLKLLEKMQFPEVNSTKLLNAQSDKESIIKITPEFNKFYKDHQKSLGENVKFVLRGGSGNPHDIDSSQLNMRAMYNFIFEYNNEIDKIVNDIVDEVKEEAKRSINTIRKKARALKMQLKNKIQTGPKNTNDANNTTTQASTQQSTDTQQSSTTSNDTAGNDNNDTASYRLESYNDTFSYYFNEMEIHTSKKDKENVETMYDRGVVDVEASDHGLYPLLEANNRIYFSLCMEYVSAILTISEEVYKNYMRIIKWHVANYVPSSEVKRMTSKEHEKYERDKHKKAEQQKQSAENQEATYRLESAFDFGLL